jgi:hypothetical protein
MQGRFKPTIRCSLVDSLSCGRFVFLYLEVIPCQKPWKENVDQDRVASIPTLLFA